MTSDVVLSLAAEMRAGLRSGAVRRMVVPLREVVEDAAGTKFLSMPAVSADYDLFINKTATIVPPGARGERSRSRSLAEASTPNAPRGERSRSRSLAEASTPNAPRGRGATVTSVVSLFSAASGEFLGTVDGAAVTNLKCAAVTALVTDRCAAKAGKVMGIIGSGVQARQQYRGVSAVRDIEEVRIYSRNPGNAEAFGRHVSRTATNGVRVVVCDSAENASRGVDILATATMSVDPLPISTALPDHVHINCMGAHTVESRELDQALLRTSVLIVEDLSTAIAEAGELHREAIELDALDSPAAAGLAARRTVFSSVGCAYLDLITCAHLRRAAGGASDMEGWISA
ncbi:MAG: hypothetical protein V7603_4673 [Micromonosporaceae bacterium]